MYVKVKMNEYLYVGILGPYFGRKELSFTLEAHCGAFLHNNVTAYFHVLCLLC